MAISARDVMKSLGLCDKIVKKFSTTTTNYDLFQDTDIKNALLELSWHGQSQVYFDFPLTGSTAAIAKIRSICRNFK